MRARAQILLFLHCLMLFQQPLKDGQISGIFGEEVGDVLQCGFNTFDRRNMYVRHAMPALVKAAAQTVTRYCSAGGHKFQFGLLLMKWRLPIMFVRIRRRNENCSKGASFMWIIHFLADFGVNCGGQPFKARPVSEIVFRKKKGSLNSYQGSMSQKKEKRAQKKLRSVRKNPGLCSDAMSMGLRNLM